MREQIRSALAGKLVALDPELHAPDATLVKRTLDGDQGSFEVLVRRHQSALYRRARWMGLDHDTASDMVQDSLIKAYESLGTCREQDRFKLWVGRILRNKCLDFLKSAARRGVVLEVPLLAASGNADLEHQTRTLRKRLNEALAALQQEQREAFLMKHGENLSYEEMAELTGTSVSAMKMRVHRARQSLRESLETEM